MTLVNSVDNENIKYASVNHAYMCGRRRWAKTTASAETVRETVYGSALDNNEKEWFRNISINKKKTKKIIKNPTINVK